MQRNKKLRRKKPAANIKPVWKADNCELWLNGVLRARFSRRAVNLRVVHSAFQEQRWRQHIDNPIPRTHGRDNKRQLHAAINGLNVRRPAF